MTVDKKTSPPFERRSNVVRKSMEQNPFQRKNETFKTRDWIDRSDRPRRERSEQQSNQ